MTRAELESTYRSPADERIIQNWCAEQLARWPVRHERRMLATSVGETHLTIIGGPPKVLLVPGTSANAVTYLPLLAALGARWPTAVVDIPGQPGLSAGWRRRRDRLSWYGRWLSEVIDETATDRLVVVGHSLGGAITLACDSPRIAARVLVGTAGLARLRLDARTLAATLPWLAHPTVARSTALVRRFLAPTSAPSASLVRWYTLVATHCRSSLAPPVLPDDVITRACNADRIVATGQHDTFFHRTDCAPPAAIGWAPTCGSSLHQDIS